MSQRFKIFIAASIVLTQVLLLWIALNLRTLNESTNSIDLAIYEIQEDVSHLETSVDYMNQLGIAIRR